MDKSEMTEMVIPAVHVVPALILLADAADDDAFVEIDVEGGTLMVFAVWKHD